MIIMEILHIMVLYLLGLHQKVLVDMESCVIQSLL